MPSNVRQIVRGMGDGKKLLAELVEVNGKWHITSVTIDGVSMPGVHGQFDCAEDAIKDLDTGVERMG